MDLSTPRPARPERPESEDLARQKAVLDQERQELARDKQDLERQKMLDAEREQLAAERRKVEAERQQLALAQRPSVSTAGETGRDGRFIAYSNGTVLDTKTNLMWAAKDNGSNINWANARSYCDNYRGGGYTDWRMPTQDELAGLYDAGKSQRAECGSYPPNHVATDLINLTCWWAWASETRGSDAATFSFINGQDGNRGWHYQSFDFLYRALPVRFGKLLFGHLVL